MEKVRILFICHGNICRSPMAEFVMKDLAAKAGLEDRFEIAAVFFWIMPTATGRKWMIPGTAAISARHGMMFIPVAAGYWNNIRTGICYDRTGSQ